MDVGCRLTGIDTYSNIGFAKLYTEKVAIKAAVFLNDRVLPFHDYQNFPPFRIITQTVGQSTVKAVRIILTSSLYVGDRELCYGKGQRLADIWMHGAIQPNLVE